MPEALKKAINSIGSGVQKLGNGLNQNLKNPLNLALPGLPETAKQVNKEIIQPGLPKPATPPPILPPTRMPTSSDARAAQRQSIIDQLRRRGRASTILTDNTDTLG
jgi:hypothetical protein